MNDYYDSLDLRVPVQHLLRNWMWIAGAGLVAALGAFVLTMMLPVLFQAEATVAISPTRTEVQFDPRIQTLADYELFSGTVVSRRDALVALVKSNEVVRAVLDDVGSLLAEEERTVQWLRESATVETTGDLINLEFRYSDPDTAMMVANAWADHYEQHVNRIYSTRGNISESRIDEQVTEARAAYDEAQAALEAYEAANPVEALQRDLDATTLVLENYQLARVSAQTRPTDRNQLLLDSYYQELVMIEGWLGDATALREQVSASVGTAGNLGNTLALITLRSRAFGGEQEGSAGILLQFDLSAPTEPVSITDVDSLIAALEQRRSDTQARIDQFLQGLPGEGEQAQLSQLNQQISSLTDRITTLRAEIEAVSAEQRELMQARDSTWETYQLLQNRQIEEQIASQTRSAEVRIADRAIVPSEPVSRGLIRNTAIAMILAALVASAFTLVRAWWRMDNVPQLEPRLSEQDGAQQEVQGTQGDVVGRQGLPESLSS